jgi:hypothetical protein
MQKLVTSRRLWTFVLSQGVAIALFVVANYIPDPKTVQLAQLIVGSVDGLAAVLMTLLTVDDVSSNVAAIKAGTHPDYPPK